MADRKKQILETAAELMQTRAFTAFSYQDISDRLGITKAAIHGHYRTKEMLGVALLKKYADETMAAHTEAERHGDGAWQRFDAFMNLMEETVVEENKVCPVCVLQVEHNIIKESMRKGVSEIYNLNRAWMSNLLKQGRDEGVMAFQGEPEDQADLILAATQGAFMNARAEDRNLFRRIVKQIKMNITSM